MKAALMKFLAQLGESGTNLKGIDIGAKAKELGEGAKKWVGENPLKTGVAAGALGGLGAGAYLGSESDEEEAEEEKLARLRKMMTEE